MAPPFSPRLPFLRRGRGVHGGLSCEIVSDLCPNPFSHDWHVQPSCQRPNRLPPERREFSPGEHTRMRIRLSSKPYKHTRVRETLSTQASHRISTCFPQEELGAADRRAEPQGLKPVVGAASAARLEVAPFPVQARSERATVWPSALASD